MILRICLKNKSSILVERESLKKLKEELEQSKFIITRDGELIASDYIWCVRKSSQTIEKKEID